LFRLPRLRLGWVEVRQDTRHEDDNARPVFTGRALSELVSTGRRLSASGRS